MSKKKFEVEIPEGTHLDRSQDSFGAYRGLLRDYDNHLVGHVELFEVDEDEDDDDEYDPSDDGDVLLGGLLLAAGVVGAAVVVSRVSESRRQKHAEQQVEVESPVVHEYVVRASRPAPPLANWYEDASGRMRWWDGQHWTAYVKLPESHVTERALPPPNWYHDAPGRMRWWNGQQWTTHVKLLESHATKRAHPPPNWYHDAPGRMRWWNGQQWTTHVKSPESTTLATQSVTADPRRAAPSTAVSTAGSQTQRTMSGAEWQERVRAMLLSRAFTEEQWRVLSNARVVDADAALLESQRELRSLTPQQLSDRITAMLERNPDMLRDAALPARPGWYDDGSGTLRWWDGRQWTDNLQRIATKVQPSTLASVPAGWPHQGSGGQRW